MMRRGCYDRLGRFLTAYDDGGGGGKALPLARITNGDEPHFSFLRKPTPELIFIMIIRSSGLFLEQKVLACFNHAEHRHNTYLPVFCSVIFFTV